MTKDKQIRDAAVSITSARARLFDLVEDVLNGRSARVELVHRDYNEHLLLVKKRDIDRLEEENQLLRSRVSPEPVPLRGMGRLVGDPSNVVERVRARHEELALEKRVGLFGVPAS